MRIWPALKMCPDGRAMGADRKVVGAVPLRRFGEVIGPGMAEGGTEDDARGGCLAGNVPTMAARKVPPDVAVLGDGRTLVRGEEWPVDELVPGIVTALVDGVRIGPGGCSVGVETPMARAEDGFPADELPVVVAASLVDRERERVELGDRP